MDTRSIAFVALLTACGSGSSSTDAGMVHDTGTDVLTVGTDVASGVDTGADTSVILTDTPTPPTDTSTTPMDVVVTPTDASTVASDGGACGFPDAFTPPANRFAPGTITAIIVDLTGAPVVGLYAILCGIDLCAGPVMTGPSGALSTNMTFAVTNPALKFGDTLTYPEFLVPVTTAGQSLGTFHTAPLPATGPAFAAGTTITSGPLTLILPAGDTIEVDTLSYPVLAQQQFRTVEIPIAQAPVDPTVGLSRVIGTTPLETLFCPPVQASVANINAWPAGTAVDFYALGTDTSSFFAPYGGWAVMSTGHVSADGSTITTDAGQGLWVLTDLGIRRHGS